MLNIFTPAVNVLIRMKEEAGHFLNIVDGFLLLSYWVYMKWHSLIQRRWKFCTYINLYIFYIKLGSSFFWPLSRIWCRSYVWTNVLLSTMETRTDLAVFMFDFCFMLSLGLVDSLFSFFFSSLWGMKRLLYIIIKVVEKDWLTASKRNLQIWTIKHKWHILPSLETAKFCLFC